MKPTIAVITNDILFWNLLQPVIKHKLPDCSVVACTSYDEIKRNFEQYVFHLVLLDGGMVGVSPIEITYSLRTTLKVIAPIWFFYEISIEAYQHRARLMGVNRLLTKPFDPYTVAGEVAEFFLHEPSLKK